MVMVIVRVSRVGVRVSLPDVRHQYGLSPNVWRRLLADWRRYRLKSQSLGVAEHYHTSHTQAKDRPYIYIHTRAHKHAILFHVHSSHSAFVDSRVCAGGSTSESRFRWKRSCRLCCLRTQCYAAVRPPSACPPVYDAGAIRFGAPQIGVGRAFGRRAPVIVLLAQDEHVHTVGDTDTVIDSSPASTAVSLSLLQPSTAGRIQSCRIGFLKTQAIRFLKPKNLISSIQVFRFLFLLFINEINFRFIFSL